MSYIIHRPTPINASRALSSPTIGSLVDTLMEMERDAFLEADQPLIKRNYTYLMAYGLNLGTPTDNTCFSNTPYHSAEDSIYQRILSQFLAELLPDGNSFINEDWINICQSHYPVPFQFYLAAQNQKSSMAAAAGTLLIRIAHFCQRLSDFTFSDDPACVAFQTKKQLAYQLIQDYQNVLSYFKTTTNLSLGLAFVLNPFINSLNQFSTCIIDDQFGPLKRTTIDEKIFQAAQRHFQTRQRGARLEIFEPLPI